jgi:hypothetical protein
MASMLINLKMPRSVYDEHNFGAWHTKRNGDGFNLEKDRLRMILSMLTDPNCKRMLLDARQLAVFAETDDMEAEMQKLLHLPFDHFWLEATTPVDMNLEHIIEYPHNGPPSDGITFTRFLGLLAQKHKFTVNPDDVFGGFVTILCFFDDDQGYATNIGFHFNPVTGEVLSSTEAICAGPHPSVLDPRQPLIHNRLDNTYWVLCGELADQPGRVIGMYEDTLLKLGALVSWVLAYLMSKGLRITEVLPTRAERRRAQREGEIPQPWHLVELDPRMISYANGDGAPIGGREHGFRYDVIGHLRFARHKLGNGSYRSSVEWVRPHQRGLKFTHYVPKTYNVKAGRVTSPEMDAYWKGGK